MSTIKQIKKIYDKYLEMRIEGIGDAYELPTDKFGQVLELNNIGKKRRIRVRGISNGDDEEEFVEDEIRPDDENESYDEEEE